MCGKLRGEIAVFCVELVKDTITLPSFGLPVVAVFASTCKLILETLQIAFEAVNFKLKREPRSGVALAEPLGLRLCTLQ